MSEVSRKEIVEIFNRNQLACDEHVTPSIKEWNKIGAHIDKLTAQVEELKALLELAGGMGFNTVTSQSSVTHRGYCDRVDELLTRTGEDK